MFDWLVGVVEQGGAATIALLMFAENVFPPIPSELVMPVAGFSAARGDTSLAVVIIAGSIGSFCGALLWYWIGRKLGADRLKRWASRHGRWLTMTPDDIDRASAFFHRHGGAAVLIGRLIPGVRTFISVPAGIAGMGLSRFCAYTVVGTAGWTAVLAVAGYLLQSQYDRVASWLNPVSTAVLVILVAIYLWRVVTFGRHAEA